MLTVPVKHVLKPHSAALFPSPFLPISHCLREAWHIFKQSKREGKSFPSLMPEWQAELTGRYRDQHDLSTRMHYAHTLSITHAQTGSTHERTTPPTLPKHYLTWQIRMCASLLVFWHCRYLSHFCQSFTLVSHQDKETQNEPTCHPSLPLSLSVLSPVFLRWVLSSEAGIWSTSQHHMLHNSQSPILIAGAFLWKIQRQRPWFDCEWRGVLWSQIKDLGCCLLIQFAGSHVDWAKLLQMARAKCVKLNNKHDLSSVARINVSLGLW